MTKKNWLKEQKKNVIDYIQKEGLNFDVDPVVEWYVDPYVSLWLISDGDKKIWVISGDLPTDYLRCDHVELPRGALKRFAQRWLLASEEMEKGEDPRNFKIGCGESENNKELTPLLRSRAKILLEWVNDESLW